MIFVIDAPIISSAVNPNIRSAAGFHDVTMPFKSLLTIASSDEATSAARYAFASIGNRYAMNGRWFMAGNDASRKLGHETVIDPSKTSARICVHTGAFRDPPCRIAQKTQRMCDRLNGTLPASCARYG